MRAFPDVIIITSIILAINSDLAGSDILASLTRLIARRIAAPATSDAFSKAIELSNKESSITKLAISRILWRIVCKYSRDSSGDLVLEDRVVRKWTENC